MFTLIETLSSTIADGFRKIKLRRFGNGDVQTARQVTPFGIDSSPVKGMRAVYGETNKKGKPVIVGYLNKNLLAADGETRMFSLDSEGALATFIWIKADGTMEIGGNADFMLRFSKTKEVIDELQSDIETLKNAFTAWTPVPNDGGAALKTGTATWAGTAFTKNIDDAKIEEIKTI
jgi:hypothetical protein